MTVEQVQDEIIDEFSLFNDWMQRYEYMIELGKSLPLIEKKHKTDAQSWSAKGQGSREIWSKARRRHQ